MPLPYPFSFQGRARRGEWWLTNIGFGLLVTLAGGAVNQAFTGDWRGLSDGGQAATVSVAIELTATVLLTWIQLAVSYRRAHDLGDSGLPLALLIAVATTGSLAVGFAGQDWMAFVRVSGAGFFLMGVWIVGALISLYFFIRLAFFPGQPTANAYGVPT